MLFPYFLSKLLIKLLTATNCNSSRKGGRALLPLLSGWEEGGGDTDGHLTRSIIVRCRAGPDNTADINSSSTYFAEVPVSQSVSVRSVSIIRVRGSCPYSCTLSTHIVNCYSEQFSNMPGCQADCLYDHGMVLPASLLSHKVS